MKRGLRVLALAAAVALALLAVPASADDHQQSTYLALGDSYAFAFNPIVLATGGASNPANFPGYSDAVASMLHLKLTNAACPGETSGSLISTANPDNGCKAYRSSFPLHASYTGAQLAFAVKYLRSHHHTDLVTLQIGGNDFLLLQSSCQGDATCILGGLPGVEAQMTANLTTIYSAIRNRAHYHGTIVAVPYFAFNYNDATNVFFTTALDNTVSAVALRFHARVADAFGAFFTASANSPFLAHVPCFAGLQVVLNAGPPPACDIHPSAAGHAVFTSAILAVLRHENDD
ncbi:MAG TPA: GDSL-type esterase/lipase family protein [Thermoanaerobaculia bacterium]|jgi:lysophospholipase L1-like esterase|nr:GDSL-type esterase/lipase family protein [Thermoanaerobaculia bacterium]